MAIYSCSLQTVSKVRWKSIIVPHTIWFCLILEGAFALSSHAEGRDVSLSNTWSSQVLPKWPIKAILEVETFLAAPTWQPHCEMTSKNSFDYSSFTSWVCRRQLPQASLVVIACFLSWPLWIVGVITSCDVFLSGSWNPVIFNGLAWFGLLWMLSLTPTRVAFILCNDLISTRCLRFTCKHKRPWNSLIDLQLVWWHKLHKHQKKRGKFTSL